MVLMMTVLMKMVVRMMMAICERTYLDLVTPARKVSESLNGHAYVCLERQSVHSPRVDGLDGGQLFLMFLHQVRKPGGGRGKAGEWRERKGVRMNCLSKNCVH